MNKVFKDSIILGFSLFSILFGAGNIIFSTYIGMYSHTKWIYSLIGFLIADIFLVLLGIISFIKNNYNEDSVYKNINPVMAKIIRIFSLACIGPLIAIPRTCAVTFEMFNVNNIIIFSLIYFMLVFIFTIKLSNVIDLLGKYLTPFLIIFMIIFLVLGISNANEIVFKNISNVMAFSNGINMGFQTLDLLCISSIGGIMFKFIQNKNYKKDKNKVIIYSILISIILLTFMYTGLSFIGASYSFNSASLQDIANKVLNKWSIILSMVVFLACFTTSVGLTSAVANSYEKITNLNYKTWIIIIIITSFIIANLGLEKIINITTPIINILYPVVIIITFLSIFKIKNKNIYSFSLISTFLLLIIKLIYELTSFPHFYSKLFLYEIGLEWLPFSILFGIIGMLFKKEGIK